MHHKLLKYDALKNIHFITSVTKFLIKLNFKRIITYLPKMSGAIAASNRTGEEDSYFVSWNLYFKSLLTKNLSRL